MEQHYKQITLKAGREKSVRAFHPWIFSGAIAHVDRPPTEGDIVEVFSAKGDYLGTGFFSGHDIAVKLFSFKRIIADCPYWTARFLACLARRELNGIGSDNETTAYRLVNAEGDEMPGLIVDVYNSCAVVQFHHTGMSLLKDVLKEALLEALPALSAVYSKSAETAEGAAAVDGYLHRIGEVDHIVKETGLRYRVDWENGQKTGFYIDQRENRSLVRLYCGGKDVLNCFCYTGGFSVNALAGGAKSVVSVDSSAPALTLLEQNLALNIAEDNYAAHRAVNADVFDYLSKVDDKYDLLVLDPPPFAKQRQSVAGALKGYRALNYQAMKRLRERGLLFTFSCSQLVGPELFNRQIARAAADAGRRFSILRHLSAPPCHPVSLHHPEGSYLKGLLLQLA